MAGYQELTREERKQDTIKTSKTWSHPCMEKEEEEGTADNNHVSFLLLLLSQTCTCTVHPMQ